MLQLKNFLIFKNINCKTHAAATLKFNCKFKYKKIFNINIVLCLIKL